MSADATMKDDRDRELERRKLRTALLVGLIALLSFLGILLKTWIQR